MSKDKQDIKPEIKKEEPLNIITPSKINGIFYIENKKYIILKDRNNNNNYNVYKIANNGRLNKVESTINNNILNIQNLYNIDINNNKLNIQPYDVDFNKYKYDFVRDPRKGLIEKGDNFYYDMQNRKYILTKDNNNEISIYRVGYGNKLTKLLLKGKEVYNEKNEKITNIDLDNKFYYLDDNKEKILGLDRDKAKLITNEFSPNLYKNDQTGNDYLLTKKEGKIKIYSVDELGRLTNLKYNIGIDGNINVFDKNEKYLFDFDPDAVAYISDDDKYNKNIKSVNPNYNINELKIGNDYKNFLTNYKIKKISDSKFIIINTETKKYTEVRQFLDGNYRLTDTRDIKDLNKALKSNGEEGLGQYLGTTKDQVLLDLQRFITVNKGEFNADDKDFQIYRQNHYDSLHSTILFGEQKIADNYIRQQLIDTKINYNRLDQEQIKFISYKARQYLIHNGYEFNKKNIDNYLNNNIGNDYKNQLDYLNTLDKNNETKTLKLYNANENTRQEHILIELNKINKLNLNTQQMNNLASDAYDKSKDISDFNLDNYLNKYYQDNAQQTITEEKQDQKDAIQDAEKALNTDKKDEPDKPQPTRNLQTLESAEPVEEVNTLTQQAEAVQLVDAKDVDIKVEELDPYRKLKEDNKEYKKIEDAQGYVLNTFQYEQIALSYEIDKNERGEDFNLYYTNIKKDYPNLLKVYLEKQIKMSFYDFVKNFKNIDYKDFDKYILFGESAFVGGIDNIPIFEENNIKNDYSLDKIYNNDSYPGLVLSSLLTSEASKESKLVKNNKGVQEKVYLKHSEESIKKRIGKKFYKNKKINIIQFKYLVIVSLLAMFSIKKKNYDQEELINIINRIMNNISYSLFYISQNRIDLIKKDILNIFNDFQNSKNETFKLVNSCLDYLFADLPQQRKINFYTLHNEDIKNDLMKLMPNIEQQFESKNKMREFFNNFFSAKNQAETTKIFQEFNTHINTERKLTIDEFKNNFKDGVPIFEAPKDEKGTTYKVRNTRTGEIVEKVFIPKDDTKPAKTIFINEEGLRYEKLEEKRQDLNEKFKELEEKLDEPETEDDEEIFIDSDEEIQQQENKKALIVVDTPDIDKYVDPKKFFLVTDETKLKPLYRAVVIKPFLRRFKRYMSSDEYKNYRAKFQQVMTGDFNKIFIPSTKLPTLNKIINRLSQQGKDIFRNRTNSFINPNDPDFKNFMYIYENIGFKGRFVLHKRFNISDDFIQTLPEKLKTFQQDPQSLQVDEEKYIYNKEEVENAEKKDIDFSNSRKNNLLPSISDLRFMNLANFSYTLEGSLLTRARMRGQKDKFIRRETIKNKYIGMNETIQYSSGLGRIDLNNPKVLKEYNEILKLFNISNTKVYSNSKAEIVIIKGKDKMLISFRGTDWTQLRDDIDDINVFEDEGFHLGFYTRAKRLLEILKDNKNILFNNKKKLPIYIAGHSLGSSTSLIASYLMLKEFKNINIQVVAWALPKFFKSKTPEETRKKMNNFDLIFNQKFSWYKVYNAHNDPVKDVPPYFLTPNQNCYFMYEDRIEIDNTSPVTFVKFGKDAYQFIRRASHSLYPNYHQLFLKNIKKPVTIIKENPLLKERDIKIDDRTKIINKIKSQFKFLSDKKYDVQFEKDITQYYFDVKNKPMPLIPNIEGFSKRILNNQINNIYNVYLDFQQQTGSKDDEFLIKNAFFKVISDSIDERRGNKKIKKEKDIVEMQVGAGGNVNLGGNIEL